MYADDIIILSETEEGLQSCLQELSQYTKRWGLEINLKKTKIMIFQTCGKRPKSVFYFNNQIVQITQSYKYLGTIISETGSFKLNAQDTKKKGLRASFIIQRNISLFSKPSTSINIFHKMVTPILTYNSEISLAFIPKTWTMQKFKTEIWNVGNEANKVFIQFLRQILGVHKKTSTIALLSETGQHPLSMKIYKAILKYWIRLHDTDNKLLKAAHKVNCQQNDAKKQNWLRMARYLNEVTESNVIPGDNPKQNNRILINMLQNLNNLFQKWWLDQTKQKGKLDFYFSFKRNFKYEKYLDHVTRSERIHMTKLRTSSHCLPIETLRYRKIKVERKDRLCTLCNLKQVGDEYHYLLHCNNSEIVSVRDTFLNSIRVYYPDMRIFSDRNIIDYCLCLHDDRFLPNTMQFIKRLLLTYKTETEPPTPNTVSHTRSGREIKKPTKLDL